MTQPACKDADKGWAWQHGGVSDERVQPEAFGGVAPLPRGTIVVLRDDAAGAGGEPVPAGSHARVLEAWTLDAPDAPVRLATLAGDEVEVPRAAVVLQRGGATPPGAGFGDPGAWDRWGRHVQLVTLVGSRAWNLAVAGSDEDRRGFWLAPFEALADLVPPPEQLQPPAAPGLEALYWELEKFLQLLLRADPNALEALFGPVVEATPFGEQVVAAREAFISRRVLGTFGRYALAQLERLEARERRNRAMELAAELWRADPGLSPDAVAARLAERLDGPARHTRTEAKEALRSLARSLHDRGRIADRDPRSAAAYLAALEGPQAAGWLDARADKPKNAMHLLRILHSGLSLLAGHGPLIRVPDGPLRDRLLAVRAGRVPLDEVLQEARDVARRLEEGHDRSPLPAAPDEAAARALLRAGRRRAHAWAIARPEPAPWPVRTLEPPGALPHALLRRFLDDRRERTFLAAVSGSHSYGFPSADSDVDLKAIHVAPTDQVVGLGGAKETHDFLGVVDGVEVDYTSHELGKACRMLLEGNGNVLEWVLGALCVREHPRARELRALTRRGLHRGYLRHYLGFSRSLLKEYERTRRDEGRGRVKPLLYVFRTALTGAHLLAAGELETDLTRLVARYPAFAAVERLVALKVAGRERAALDDDAPFLPLVAEVHALLERSHATSPLPEASPVAAELSAWVADVRLSDG